MPKPWQTSSPLGVLDYIYHRHYKDTPFLRDRLLRDCFSSAETLSRKHLKGHFGCVNAIEFSNDGGERIVSGGDDRRVLLWNVEEGISGIAKPAAMKGEHHSNIFCLAFDNANEKVFSGGNDQQVLVHDVETGQTKDVFNHEDAVYGLSVDPLNDNVFASACDDGRILIYDIREPASEAPFCLANYLAQMHAVMYNPAEPRLLVTANSKEGVGLWDIRKPRSCLLRYGGSLSAQSCMSVRINRRGDQVIALRRRLPPVLYSISSPLPVFQFDHAGYYNSCTMKSCCFAGDNDQYLISGSDDFNLYVWRIPEEPREVPWVGEAHLVLKGHRSIVNQVRFNPSNHLLISSGVEKVIKIWSAFTLPDRASSEMWTPLPLPDPGFEGEPEERNVPSVERSRAEDRPVYTHEEYINLVLRSGQVMSHDYSHQSTEEDPRMMAFFDSLVQRELEGYTTEEDSLDSSPDLLERLVQQSHSDNSESGRGEQSHSEEEGGYSPFTIAFASAMASRAQNEERNSETESGGGGGNLLDMDLQGAAVDAATGDPLDVPTAGGGANTEGTGGTDILPGQRHISGRRSISDLITQKRKDYRYLSNAQKTLPKSCKKLKLSKKLCTSAAAAEQGNSSSSSSDSDSDSDSSSATSSNGPTPRKYNRRKLRKRFKRNSSSSSSDSASEDVEGMGATQVAEIRNFVSANKRLGLQRLRRMREQVLNSDSESQEAPCSHKLTTRVKSQASTSSATNGCVNHNEPKASTSSGSSFLKMLEEAPTSESEASGLEMGPFLSETVISQNGTNHAPNPTGELMPSNGLTGSHLSDGLSNGNDALGIPVSTMPAVHNDKAATNGRGDNNNDKSGPSRLNGEESATNGATGTGAATVTPKGDIPWIEFKRFENRVERVRRQYRKRHHDKSSGEDVS